VFRKLRPHLVLLLLFASLCLFTGCQQRLSVQTQYFTYEDLASAYIDTPDPQVNNPPAEQRLIITWNLADDCCESEKILNIYVRLKNREKIEASIPLNCSNGTYVFKIYKDRFFATGGFLTYRVEIVVDGRVVEEFQHQLWTELIEFEK